MLRYRIQVNDIKLIIPIIHYHVPRSYKINCGLILEFCKTKDLLRACQTVFRKRIKKYLDASREWQQESTYKRQLLKVLLNFRCWRFF